MPERDLRPALNGLRALAALAVVVYHFRFYADFPIVERHPWLWFFQMGVDFFFVLSGLIISHVYFAGFAAGTASYREFLFLRLSRIFPVHALVMVLMLAAALAGWRSLTASDFIDWVSLTLLVRQWLLPDGYVWNSAAWSISAEMFAYALVFPAIVVGTRRLGPAAAACVLLGLGLLAFQVLGSLYGSLSAHEGAGPLLRVTAGFLLGAGLHRLLAGRERTARADRLLVAGLVLVILAVAVLQVQVHVVLGLATVIAGAYLSDGPLARLLAHRVPFYLGEISYSLYLVHLPLFMACAPAADALGVPRGLAFCTAVTLLSILAAALLYETVEVPARRAMRSWWSQRRASPPPLPFPNPNRPFT
jgi:peptidoglycan/LPS O-acetylase OafA/YrhL